MTILAVNAVCCLLVCLSGMYLLGWSMRSFPWYYKMPMIAVTGIQGLHAIGTFAALIDDTIWLEMGCVPISMSWSQLALAWLAVAIAVGTYVERSRKSSTASRARRSQLANP